MLPGGHQGWGISSKGQLFPTQTGRFCHCDSDSITAAVGPKNSSRAACASWHSSLALVPPSKHIAWEEA